MGERGALILFGATIENEASVPKLFIRLRYVMSQPFQRKSPKPDKVEMWVGGLGESTERQHTPHYTPCVAACAEP